jgi:cytochrome P450
MPSRGDCATATPGPPGLASLPPGVSPIVFLGDLIDRHGDVVRYQTRFGPCFLFVHPEHVGTVLHRETYKRASLVKMMLGDGLLASDGPWWRSQRRLVQPGFLPAAVGRFAAVVARETDRLAADWRAAVGPVDVTAAMTRLTLRVVVAALFSEDLPDGPADALCAAVSQNIIGLGKLSWTVFGAPVRLAPDTTARLADTRGVIDAVCHDMIARRRSLPPGDRPRDLLTMLVEAHGDTGPLTDVQVRDEIVTMLVGGHETTALALAWAWRAIAEDPAVEARLVAEADAVLADRAPDSSDVPRLPWAAAVFQESMRLYPPVWYMARTATADDVVDGHAVPKGACVLVSAWFTHRHRGFWPDAERFDPARFLDAAARPAHRYAYMPFGGGRHQCVGMHFAMMEGTLILAQLARAFRVRPVNGDLVRPDPGITLRQTPGLLARVEPRRPRATPVELGAA